MEGGARAAEMRPLGERFEMVDRLARLDLDDDLQLVASVLRHQEEVRIQRRGAGSNRRVLLVTRIHRRFVSPAKLGVQQADYAVVLELLTNGPHQDRTQRAPPNRWISTEIETAKFSMNLSSSSAKHPRCC
jgi:hypothetical protein